MLYYLFKLSEFDLSAMLYGLLNLDTPDPSLQNCAYPKKMGHIRVRQRIVPALAAANLCNP